MLKPSYCWPAKWQYQTMVLSFTNALLKIHDARSYQQCQAIMTSRVNLLLIAKSNNNNIPLYNDHLFFPLIALSNAIKRIVVSLTTHSSSNIIQYIIRRYSLNDSTPFHDVQKDAYTYIFVCIEHNQSTLCICKVRRQDIILPDNQVVHAANCKKQWCSLAKWQIVSTSISTNLESPMGHKMNAMFVTKVITMINLCTKGYSWWRRKSAVTLHSIHNWCLSMQRTSGTSLVQLLICVVLVTQKQTPNVTSNAMINVVRPLNASKRQCHFDNHNDRGRHNNCDVSTHAQDYCPILTE